MNVAFTGATKDKDMVVSSGAVTFSLHLPSFSYNGDDTFVFQENGTAWLLRVSQNSVDIEATVAAHIGKKAHSFTYDPGSATVTIDQNGSLNVGNAALVSRAVVRGADGKLYGICSPWSTSGSAAAFTCDDTALPSAAFPYVIDPSTTTWPFNSSFFSMPSSPVEYVGTGSAAYFSWTATVNLNAVAPVGSIITSSSINAGGLGGSTAWDSRWGDPAQGTCTYYNSGTDNSSQAWVTALTYWPGSKTAGCILSVSGQSSLSGTVTWWIPSVTPPGTIGSSERRHRSELHLFNGRCCHDLGRHTAIHVQLGRRYQLRLARPWNHQRIARLGVTWNVSGDRVGGRCPVWHDKSLRCQDGDHHAAPSDARIGEPIERCSE
jgi:hypothetical protein